MAKDFSLHVKSKTRLIPVRCIDDTSSSMIGQGVITKSIIKPDLGQKAEIISILDSKKIETFIVNLAKNQP